MTPSDPLLAFLRGWEALRLNVYTDGGGVWTIGYGHTGSDVHAGMTCTPAQAEAWLEDDAAACGEAVEKAITFTLSQQQFDALVAFTFNVGAHSLYAPAMSRAARACPTAVAEQMPRWCHDNGVEVPGLKRRRAAELAIFNNGYYSCRP